MALLPKTVAEFVTELEDETGRKLIGLTFLPVSTGNPIHFIAVFGARQRGDQRTDQQANVEVWDVGP